MTDSKALMAAAEKAGWVKVRQSGGHAIYKHESRPDTVSIPIRNINPGLVKEIKLKLKHGDQKDTLGRMGKELAAPKVIAEPDPELANLKRQLSEAQSQLQAQSANSARVISELEATKTKLATATSTIEELKSRPVEPPKPAEPPTPVPTGFVDFPPDLMERPVWSRNLTMARLRMNPSPTQLYVSKHALNMNYNVISFFELGRRVIPNDQQWKKLAEYYGTTVEALKGKEPVKLRQFTEESASKPEPPKPVMKVKETLDTSASKKIMRARVDELLDQLSDEQVNKLGRMMEALLTLVVFR